MDVFTWQMFFMQSTLTRDCLQIIINLFSVKFHLVRQSPPSEPTSTRETFGLFLSRMGQILDLHQCKHPNLQARSAAININRMFLITSEDSWVGEISSLNFQIPLEEFSLNRFQLI